MKYPITLLLALLLFPGWLHSQSAVTQWLVEDNTLVDFATDPSGAVLLLKQTGNGYGIDRYAPNGSLAWTLSDTTAINVPLSIRLDRSGFIYVLGNQRVFDRTESFYVGQGVYKSWDFYHTALCLDKFDSGGNRVNRVKYTASSSVSGLHLRSWDFDSENRMILSANTADGDQVHIDTCAIGWRDETYPSGSILFTVSLDTAGHVTWLNRYPYYLNPSKSMIESGDRILTTGSSRCQLITDSLYQTGCYGLSDGWVARFDGSGNLLWSNHIGSPADDEILDASMHENQDLTFFLSMGQPVGQYNGATFQGDETPGMEGVTSFIGNLDESGDLAWIRPIRLGNTIDQTVAMAVSGAGSVLGLNFRDTLQYGEVSMGSPSVNNGCILRIDSAGAPVWWKQFGSGIAYTRLDKVQSQNPDQAIVMVSYYSPFQLDGYALTSSSGRFVCKILRDPSSGTDPVGLGNSRTLTVYPNPATTSLTIETSLPEEDASLILFDGSGRVILEQKIRGIRSVVDISRLTPGIYLWRMVGNRGVKTGKVIKR